MRKFPLFLIVIPEKSPLAKAFSWSFGNIVRLLVSKGAELENEKDLFEYVRKNVIQDQKKYMLEAVENGMRDRLRGNWNRDNHLLFNTQFRFIIFTVMLIHRRKETLLSKTPKFVLFHIFTFISCQI